MENQHQKITGYRDLTLAEVDLMNKIKAHGEASAALIEEVTAHVTAQHEAARPAGIRDVCTDSEQELARKSAEMSRLYRTAPYQWLTMAKASMQLGTMELVRAVAQPTSF